MARSNHNKEDSDPAVTNGFPCHENGITLCSHASKRKRHQKPKIIKENESAQIVVEKLLKTEHCINGGKRPQSKPCRRSERKTMPSSLWDNAVINPFFERKRRKLVESPVKSPPTSNGSSSSNKDNVGPETVTNCNGVSAHNESKMPPDKSLIVSEVNSSRQNQSMSSQSEALSDKETDSGTTTANSQPKTPPNKSNATSQEQSQSADTRRHVRLRRSSRKHSSSVSSISDSKYTIKQELLQKINVSDSVEDDVDETTESTTEEVKMGMHVVSIDCKAEPEVPVENQPLLLNGNSNDHATLLELNAAIVDQPKDDQIDVNKDKIPVRNAVNKKISPLKKVINSKLSPVKELVNRKISTGKVPKTSYQHVSGCKENYKSVDDEIEVKTCVADLKQSLSTRNSNCNSVLEYSPVKVKTAKDEVLVAGDEVKTPHNVSQHSDNEIKQCDPLLEVTDERVYIDSLGRRGRKRGRRSRHKVSVDSSQSEESPATVPVMPDVCTSEVRAESATPENEITISKDDITSKEALQLIDGSSFQRFYKMRTRRQNSSNDQTPGIYSLVPASNFLSIFLWKVLFL